MMSLIPLELNSDILGGDDDNYIKTEYERIFKDVEL